MTKDEKRVIVTRPVVGICNMQVCIVKDATDEEILRVCNKENPSGTSHGWATVVRSDIAICANDKDRQHLFVQC